MLLNYKNHSVGYKTYKIIIVRKKYGCLFLNSAHIFHNAITDSSVITTILSERWVVCLCNEPMAVHSARHDSRLKFLPIT